MIKKSENPRKLLLVEREELILSALGEGVRTVSELAQTLQVSEATVRRDLLELEKRDLARRVHGGAVRCGKPGEPLFHEKTTFNAAAKEEIARKALTLIHDNDVIYLDGGSTVLSLARLLANRGGNLTIITNSLMAATELMESNCRLILLGGEFRPIARTLVGPLTLPVTETLNVDKAFLGTIGISAEGLSTTDPNEAFTKKSVMSRAKEVILLADSSKFGVKSLTAAGTLNEIHTVVSDRNLKAEFVRLLTKHKIKLIN